MRIIDYKSGQTEFDLTEIFYGLSLQLVVYLESIAKIEGARHPDKPVIKAGMFYYHMLDPVLEEMPDKPENLENQLISMLKLEGLVNDDPQVVAWMDEKPEEAAPGASDQPEKRRKLYKSFQYLPAKSSWMNWDILCIGVLKNWPGDGCRGISAKIHI